MNSKVYVDVMVTFDSDGNMKPMLITWEDGRKFIVDKIIDVRPAASLKAGGQGDRYSIIVLGRQSYLFFERSAAISGCRLGRWFVERKTA
ncbi:MAG: hypothetical protein IJT36_03360 [Alphaproteobacteria bacterium]|nr:hypothetical protein [Clostridia bacterium]MBQ7673547.1 hypothetical protein [Alphaproteobacteria bacterium]